MHNLWKCQARGLEILDLSLLNTICETLFKANSAICSKIYSRQTKLQRHYSNFPATKYFSLDTGGIMGWVLPLSKVGSLP